MVGRIIKAEMRGRSDHGITIQEARLRVLWLFLLMVLGILVKWFFDPAMVYIADPSKGLLFGSWLSVVAKIAVSVVIGLLLFDRIYERLKVNTSESWVPFLLAFQNGFFWQAAFDALAKGFKGLS